MIVKTILVITAYTETVSNRNYWQKANKKRPSLNGLFS